jgi:hypothetical protein
MGHMSRSRSLSRPGILQARKVLLRKIHPHYRWLDLTREDENMLWDHSMIFGYGPRVCLGKE